MEEWRCVTVDCVWVSPLSLTREPAWVSERVCVCVSSVELSVCENMLP